LPNRPWAAAVEWQDNRSAVLKQKAMKYDSDSHAANVFINGADETTKGRFIRDSDKATVERHRWEARPIEFPIGKSFNLTQQGKISRNPRLNGLISAANNYEREWREGARAKARQDIADAQRNLKELEAAAQK
jgi:GAF domain-containing protein